MKKTSKKLNKTGDALDALYCEFIEGDARQERLFYEELANAEVAQQIYDIREEAGLTQQELARLIGTTASVISRLEDADYQGHSLAMLNRIALALDKRIEVRFTGKPVAEQLIKSPIQPVELQFRTDAESGSNNSVKKESVIEKYE